MNKILTPGRAIRKYCLMCVGESALEVRNCTAGKKNTIYDVCPTYPYRLGKGRPSVKVIRKFCLQCMCGSKETVKNCPTENCLFYSYRFGKSPNNKSKGRSDEQLSLTRAKKGTSRNE